MSAPGARGFVLLAGAVFGMACSFHSRQPFCTYPGEAVPEYPFSLAVHLSKTQATIGELVQVTYELTNQSSAAITVSTDDWNEYRLIAADGRATGLVTISTGCPAFDDVLRIPAGGTLRWSRDVEVPEVAPGAAKFIGVFNSPCSGWAGEVRSKPVLLEVLAKPGTDATAGRIVFGFACASQDTLRGEELRGLVREALSQAGEPEVSDWGNRAVPSDLDKDGRNEVLLPLTCGATCNCSWGVFTVAPPRHLGTVHACVIRVERAAGGWARLLAYQHVSAGEGRLVTYAFGEGAYYDVGEREVTAAEAIEVLGCGDGEMCCE